MTTMLSVNLNKMALLRNSRGGGVPALAAAAREAIAAGAGGITLHPRVDARHALLADVLEMAALEPIRTGRIELNVEGDPRPDLLACARRAKAAQFTLVPVDPGERTSTRGWRPSDGTAGI